MAIFPLSVQLKAISAGVRLTTPQAAAGFDSFIARLNEVGAGSAAPAIGDQMPDFVMPDMEGRLVGLRDLLTKGPLVLAFLRGHWCPYCSTTASGLRNLAETLAGVAQVAAICPETRPFALGLSEAGGHLYPLLTDVDGGYALSTGLAIWADDTLQEIMARFGADLPLFNRSENGILPIPALFVLDRAGRVVFRDVNPDWRVRADPAAVLAAVRAAA